MNRRMTAALITAATLVLSHSSAHAGPCTEAIAHFEQAVRASANNPNAGPLAPQTIGAQLGRQPTPALVKQDEERARAAFEAALVRAKRFDAQGRRARCTRALAHAKSMYVLH
jgi:hypothetical protein